MSVNSNASSSIDIVLFKINSLSVASAIDRLSDLHKLYVIHCFP